MRRSGDTRRRFTLAERARRAIVVRRTFSSCAPPRSGGNDVGPLSPVVVDRPRRCVWLAGGGHEPRHGPEPLPRESRLPS